MEDKDFVNINYAKIFKKRFENIELLKNPDILASAYKVYKNNPVLFITDWMITFDPRSSTCPYMPFILFDRQEKYINWLLDKYNGKMDGLVEKSRDMGITWLNVAFAVWLWLFRNGIKIGFGSRKESLVDRIGDPDSILEKARMIIVNLPRYFIPKGFSPNTHLGFLKIVNPENNNTITGEGGDNIGRGGRSTIYFKDESAFYQRPEKIEAALSLNSDCKIDCSTPNGIGNPFYRKRYSGEIPVFTFHWKQDPRKDNEWYEKQKRLLDPITVAQEIDISYDASVENICIPMNWIRASVNLDIPAEGEIVAGLDVADEGGDKNAYISRHGKKIKTVKLWGEGDTTQTTRKAFEFCKKDGVERLGYDNIGVGAGVKGESRSLLSKMKRVNIQVIGVSYASAPTTGMVIVGRKNRDMFANLKAQLWWSARTMFHKTYQHVNNIKKYNYDELVSIPDNPELIAELSQVKFMYNESGKIMIEKKTAMKKRGLKSPNLADAFMICFAPRTGQVIEKMSTM